MSVKSVSGCCGSAPIRAPLRPSSSVVRDLSPAPPVSPPEGGPRQQSVRARRPSCHLPDRPGGCLQVSKSVRTSARASVPTLSVSSPRRAPAPPPGQQRAFFSFPHQPCAVLCLSAHAYWVLIGAWTPMLRPIWGFRRRPLPRVVPGLCRGGRSRVRHAARTAPHDSPMTRP